MSMGRKLPKVKCRFGIKEPRGRTTVCLRNVPNNYTRCLAKMSPKDLKFVARGQMFYLNLLGVLYKHLKARKKKQDKKSRVGNMSVSFGGSRDHILSQKMPTRCCYVLEKKSTPRGTHLQGLLVLKNLQKHVELNQFSEYGPNVAILWMASFRSHHLVVGNFDGSWCLFVQRNFGPRFGTREESRKSRYTLPANLKMLGFWSILVML